jgi:hypothetical protein
VGSCAPAFFFKGIVPIFKTNFLQGDSQNVFVALLVTFLALRFVDTLLGSNPSALWLLC